MNSQALADLHDGFDKQIQRISKCMATDELGRPDLEDLVLECLPPRLRLGDYLFDRDEVIEMVRRYYERNLTSKIPVEASDFVPIELFDADSNALGPGRSLELPNSLPPSLTGVGLAPGLRNRPAHLRPLRTMNRT